MVRFSEQLVMGHVFALLAQAKIPVWFKSQCSYWLSYTILRPRGIAAVFFNMLSGDTEHDQRRMDQVVNVVLQKPKQCATWSAYYQISCPQLIKLLHYKTTIQNAFVQKAAMQCIAKFVEKDKQLSKEHLLVPILQPLYDYMEYQKKHVQLGEKDQTIVDEHELVQCVEDVHKLLTGIPSSEILLSSLSEGTNCYSICLLL